MGFTQQLLFRIFVPTTFLLYATLGPVPAFPSFYGESFGNSDLHIQVFFDTNPEGFLQQYRAVRKVKFRGAILFRDREEPVTGTWYQGRGHTTYVFQTPNGEYRGQLEATHSLPCALRFFWTSGTDVKVGALTAQF